MDFHELFKISDYLSNIFGMNHLIIKGQPFQREIYTSWKKSLTIFVVFLVITIVFFYYLNNYKLPQHLEATSLTLMHFVLVCFL